jgi:hypothetical protein
MDTGFFVIAMLAVWLVLRLNRRSMETKPTERSTKDILIRIEHKLDELLLA